MSQDGGTPHTTATVGHERPLVPLRAAQEAVMAVAGAPVAVTVPAADALGLVLAEPVAAVVDVPPFANAAMDGFAVQAADTGGAPVVLPVRVHLPAGSGGAGRIGPGEAARIMTGAPIPPGADAVVMIEHTEEAGEGAVRILSVAGLGQHVRPRGDDVTAGSTVLDAGTVLGPAALGVLASIGCGQVRAYRRPRVGVLSSGDEVVDARRAAALGPGQIWDANRPSVLGALASVGCDPVDLGVAADDEDEIAALLEEGLGRCDAVLTTGGVSLGDFDWARSVLDRLSSGRMHWMEVAIKPAKPVAFGTVGGKPVVCLPGNPVSSLVSFELFARPLLRQMAGDPFPFPPVLAAVADRGIRRTPDGKLHLVRVGVRADGEGVLHATPVHAQGSHQLAATALATALALVDDGEGVLPGQPVRLLLLAPPLGSGGVPGTGAPAGPSGR